MIFVFKCRQMFFLNNLGVTCSIAPMKKKAIGIISGGLDSWLAALLIKNQGFDVTAVHFSSPFYGYKTSSQEMLKSNAEKLGVNLIIHKMDDDYLRILRNPVYGYGKAFNPCIDCHTYMLSIAKKYMQELGAEFVFSGEVLGQRPMSQGQNQLYIVERDSGLSGYLIRPLSAQHLNASIPEQNGIVDRSKLLDIKGRRRERQFELAKELGLTEYPTPGGGCKLTDPNLTERFEYFFDHDQGLNLEILHFARMGRLFKLDANTLLVSTREESEFNDIQPLLKYGVEVHMKDYAGSTGLLFSFKGTAMLKTHSEYLNLVASIIARYSKAFQLSVSKPVAVFSDTYGDLFEVEADYANEAMIKKYII
jgi:tRNA-uridine 2-sulfurtransferase